MCGVSVVEVCVCVVVEVRVFVVEVCVCVVVEVCVRVFVVEVCVRVFVVEVCVYVCLLWMQAAHLRREHECCW